MATRLVRTLSRKSLSHACKGRSLLESLEQRTLLSGSLLTTSDITAALPAGTPFQLTSTGLLIQPIHSATGATPHYISLDSSPSLTSSGTLSPYSTSSPSGITPAQMRKAYGIDQITFGSVVGDGTGQTIAIVDAYDYPTALADLNAFSTHFGLPTMNTAGGPTFKKVNQTGGSNLPGTDPGSKGDDWEVEEALDIEWAHSIAPGANILLVEANDASDNLYTAVNYAKTAPGVSAVSMSWGSDEFSGETQFDSTFTTPAGHAGVTFLASTGDSAAPGGYPAYSPNVVAVGGTSLYVGSTGTYLSETGWSGSPGVEGGGGGISLYEAQPSYQRGVVTQSNSSRTEPDVSSDADPNTGVPIYDTYDFGSSAPWFQVGGTSLSCPCWAGIISIVNQGRAISGGASLDGRANTLPRLYSIASSNFHDITSGSNGFLAGTGYDLVTGRGSPIANTLVQSLAAVPTIVFTQQPSTALPHHAIVPAITVTIEDQFGSILTTDNANITLSVASGPGTIGGTVTVTAVNGVATFSNISLSAAGNYTLSASASDGASNVTSSSFTISQAPTQLVFTTQPTLSNAGLPIAGPVTVSIEYANGTVVNTDSNITLTIASGNGTLVGITTLAAVNGVAAFTNVKINTAGTFVLAAADPQDVLSNFTSNSFMVQSGVAAQLALIQQPSTVVAGVAISPGVTVAVEDGFGNVITTNTSNVTISTASGPGSVGGTTTVHAVAGIATFSNLLLTAAGNYTLSAASGNFTATSNSFLVNPAAAAHLTFQEAPSNITAGQAFSPTITALLTDQFGNTATTDVSNVTISTASGPGAIIGTATVQAANGFATFSNVTINKTGTYTLSISGSGMTSATSGSFDVLTGPAAQLAFMQQPTTVASSSNFGLVMQVEDAAGNFVANSTAPARLSLVGGPLGGKIGGTLITNAVAGIVTVSGLNISNTTGYFTLGATLPGAITSYSAPIVVTAPPVKLAITQQPQLTVNAGKPISTITVQLLDSAGHLSAANSAITISLTNPNGAVLGGTKTVTSVNGVASFSNLTISKAGTYTLKVTSGTLQSATTRSITVQPAGTHIPTSTSLAASNAVPIVGQSLTLTASVAAGGATLARTGTITFYDGSTRLGAVSLNANSAASFAFTPTTTGLHNFKAVYSGDATYKTSTGLLAETVQPNPLAPLIKAAARKKK
ncbi:MAG TPA: Ig-like domain repeat protein [Phycisphaerae bacterium]|nr:Ig-like domain repeat protein [Phycisphaerae bacterium]